MMSRDVAILVVDQVMVIIWRGATSKQAVEQLSRAGQDLLKKHGSGVAIGVIEETARLPTSEEREHSARVNDELAAAGMVAFAGVMPGHGFIAASIRGVVTGLTLLSRKRYPFKVFQDSREALIWCDAQLGGTVKIAKVASAIEEFREDYARAHRSAIN